MAASRIQKRWRDAKKKAELSSRSELKNFMVAEPVSFRLDDSIPDEHQPFELAENGRVTTVVRESADRSYQYIRTVIAPTHLSIEQTF